MASTTTGQVGAILVDVSVSMMLGFEASNANAAMRRSLKAGSKTVHTSDKPMEVVFTSIITHHAQRRITKSYHEPFDNCNLQMANYGGLPTPRSQRLCSNGTKTWIDRVHGVLDYRRTKVTLQLPFCREQKPIVD